MGFRKRAVRLAILLAVLVPFGFFLRWIMIDVLPESIVVAAGLALFAFFVVYAAVLSQRRKKGSAGSR